MGSRGARVRMAVLTLLSAPALMATAVQADDTPSAQAELPQTHLTVIGSLRDTAQYRDIEVPFWTRQLAADSGGRITASLTPFDSTGLKGAEALQMARLGVISFLTIPLSLISSEDPEANASDLPGLNPSLGDMQANLAAYRPVLVDLYRKRYGLEPLAVVSYPGQVVFCTERFQDLSDLVGRRIRVASAAQATLVNALGARGVVMPLGDVTRGLKENLIDCAITGTLTGNAMGLVGMTHYIDAATLNWGLQIVLANRAVWLALAPEVRAFLAAELQALERRVWDQIEHATAQGFACDTGQDDCTEGVKGDMVLVAAAASDKAVLDRILKTVTLPKWAARCGEDCAAEWNRTVGARMGLKAEAGAP